MMGTMTPFLIFKLLIYIITIMNRSINIFAGRGYNIGIDIHIGKDSTKAPVNPKFRALFSKTLKGR